MFNLIISIIAIALVVVLAGASLYYGGSAFNQGSSDAKAATLINQAQQIQAAATLYAANEGGAAENFAALSTDNTYMAATPKLPVGTSGAWELIDADAIAAATTIDAVGVKLKAATKADAGITKDICKTVNSDGAGVVFCTMGVGAVDAVAASGSTDADIDALKLVEASEAVVHMVL